MLTVRLSIIFTLSLLTMVAAQSTVAQQYRKPRYALILNATTVNWHKVTDNTVVESSSLKRGDTIIITGVNRDSVSGRGLSYAVQKAHLVGEVPIAAIARFVLSAESIATDTTAIPTTKTHSEAVDSGGKEQTSQQCTATTKAGTRCTRMTTRASGKCWQHDK